MTGETVPDPVVVAEVRSYQELIEALRRWFLDEMRTTFATVDELAQLSATHTDKLLRPVPIKSLGPQTLGPILGAGALRLLLCVDTAALQRLKRHRDFVPAAKGAPYARSKNARSTALRHRKHRAAAVRNSPFSGDPQAARMLQSRWVLSRTPKQRQAQARKAAATRWGGAGRAAGIAPAAGRRVRARARCRPRSAGTAATKGPVPQL